MPKLTDAIIRRAGLRRSGYKLSDGDGLYLFVPPRGHRAWRYDYRLDGRRRTVSLGLYPDVSIAKARGRLLEARALVADGVDPSAAKQDARRAARGTMTFSALADEWLRKHEAQLASKTAWKKRWQVDAFLRPALGRLPVHAIQPADILPVLTQIEARGHHDTARRTRQVCGQILRYGVAHGRIPRDVTADLRDALVPAATVHRPALTDPRAVGALLRAIQALDSPQLSAALWLLALTFVRPGELRLAQWTEFDLDGALWRLPPARTKQRAAHVVPLSRQALDALTAARAVGRGSAYVLPAQRTTQRPLSDAAFAAALARIGYKGQMSPHGFRAMARTLLDERLHEEPDVIEVQLGHSVRGPLGDAYNRSRYLPQRTAMMQRWADYLDGLVVS